MKKIIVLTFYLVFVTVFSLTAQNRPHHEHERGHNLGKKPGGGDGGGGVNAPLDGGLLLVLGGAGVAYLAARKKKENS
jgi:hypothetical protein